MNGAFNRIVLAHKASVAFLVYCRMRFFRPSCTLFPSVPTRLRGGGVGGAVGRGGFGTGCNFSQACVNGGLAGGEKARRQGPSLPYRQAEYTERARVFTSAYPTRLGPHSPRGCWEARVFAGPGGAVSRIPALDARIRAPPAFPFNNINRGPKPGSHLLPQCQSLFHRLHFPGIREALARKFPELASRAGERLAPWS